MTNKDWGGNKRTTYAQLGASNHCDHERQNEDFYATDSIAIDKLKAVYDIPKDLIEISAGNGHLSERLKELGHNVISWDIVQRDYPLDKVQDFLTVKELPKGYSILTNPPFKISSEDVFVDLFGGSGVVSMNYKGKQATIYNEFNENIVELVKMMTYNDPEELDKYWNDVIDRYGLEKCSIKAADRLNRLGYDRRRDNYNRFRTDYNSSTQKDYRDLFLLSCYSINHLIRFNTNNEFNASSGADSYNDVNYQRVKDMHETFKEVKITCQDALALDLNQLSHNTFIYCDVPYLNTEAVYNEKRAFGGWTIESDYKMFKLLEEADKRGIKWGLSNVSENRGKKNQHLIDWCEKNGWQVYHLDRNYNPFSRGNSNNDEVYICNYPSQQEQQKQEGVKYKKADLLDI